FLGQPYRITGMVVKGDRIGNTIGYPTANIEIDSKYKLVPADGIYAVTVTHANHTYGGMLYIGFRPTVGGTRRAIEVNIFDFDRDIYGETLIVHFHKRLRGDKTFEGLSQMTEQLAKDKEDA